MQEDRHAETPQFETAPVVRHVAPLIDIEAELRTKHNDADVQRREFRRERQATMAQIRMQIESAQAEIATAQAAIVMSEQTLSSGHEAVERLKAEYQGLGRAVNFGAISERKLAIAGESEALQQSQTQLAKAIRYEQGLRKHLENLERHHAA